MKSVLEKGYLLGLSLLWIFLIVGIVSVVNWLTIKTSPEEFEHKIMLHSLYLSGNSNEVLMWTTSEEVNLKISNWLSVWWKVEWSMSSIGWGSGNNVSSSIWWGIWWWKKNRVKWHYSAIGGWENNVTNWDNSVVIWWYRNKVFSGWIVLWWQESQPTNGAVLGWSGNKAMINSLVLGQGAEWEANSFAWNGKAGLNTAMINADSWVLIWTAYPINGVSLVVSWSVKLGNGSDVVWAIKYNNSWCIVMYDGYTSHALGRSSKSVCEEGSWCQFGSALLQNGDIVTGYTVPYSTGCSTKIKTGVQCNNWNFSQQIYPYCYNISSDPKL